LHSCHFRGPLDRCWLCVPAFLRSRLTEGQSLIGGTFARPTEHFHFLRHVRFLQEWPYFLPSGISALFPLIGFLLIAFFYQETTFKRRAVPPEEAAPPSKTPSPELPTWKTRQMGLIMANYSLISILLMATNALVPLFAFTPALHGGLGLAPRQIGLALAWIAVWGSACQLLAFPVLHRAMGSVGVLRLTVSLDPLFGVVLPLASYFAQRGRHQLAYALFYVAITVSG
jgi:hypothetical protein